MHILVAGAGAIGLLYGGWAIAGGATVSFLSRSRQVAMLQRHGFTLRGGLGETHIRDFDVTHDPSNISTADVILLAVKMYDLEPTAEILKQHLRPGGLVLGLQNGVDVYETLCGVFSPQEVLVGSAYNAVTLRDSRIVEYTGARNSIVVGTPAKCCTPLARDLVSIWQNVGIEATISEDINAALWTKFLGFSTNAAITCLSRQSAGYAYSDPDLLDIARRAIAEVFTIARCEGITLPDSVIKDTVRLLQSFPNEMVASMRQDLDAGRRLELESVSGLITRYGRKHGVDTPIHSTAYACLKPFRDGFPEGSQSLRNQKCP